MPLDLHLLAALDQTLLSLPVDVIDRLLQGSALQLQLANVKAPDTEKSTEDCQRSYDATVTGSKILHCKFPVSSFLDDDEQCQLEMKSLGCPHVKPASGRAVAQSTTVWMPTKEPLGRQSTVRCCRNVVGSHHSH